VRAVTYDFLPAPPEQTPREREPNNEIQMGAPRSAQVISWRFMAPLREMEAHTGLHSKAASVFIAV
jgi:hypothetical protein